MGRGRPSLTPLENRGRRLHHADFRFYAELNDFLPPGDRHREVIRSFPDSPTVKDQVEACGVPHTEVDLILVNGVSVGFDHHLSDGDRVSVYPVFEALDVTPLVHLRPRPLREPRFVLDVHLGKLARRLRLLGFDAVWSREAGDEELVAISLAEKRILLSRDRGLLKRRELTHAAAIRATEARRRSLLRLKYSLMADEAINNTLPDTLDEFDDALQSGELKKLYASLDDILED